MKKIELSGLKFGNLTVLHFDHYDKWGQACWRCACDCGNETIVASRYLRTGHTTSCGCRKYYRFGDDIIGRRFGRLTVIQHDHMEKRGRSYYLCECDCTNTILARRDLLLSGHTRSCGCYATDINRSRSTTHGMSETRLYNIWRQMRQRCGNSNSSSYCNYGNRGIYVCDEWDTFENFYDWAINNGYESSLSIDRINNDEGYSPENCRWADSSTQANNKRTCHYVTYNDLTHTVTEWSRILGVHAETLRHRIKHGDMSDFEKHFCEED